MAKDKDSIKLPKAWQMMKHRNETANAKADYNAIWGVITFIIVGGLIAFILLGGISQTGLLKFIFRWSSNTSNTVANTIGGGSVIVNEDGIYLDPTGKSGEKIIDSESTNQNATVTEEATTSTTENNDSSSEESEESEEKEDKTS